MLSMGYRKVIFSCPQDGLGLESVKAGQVQLGVDVL